MRETACRKALRQVEQEGGEAFFGAHGAEQHHDAVVADDFAAHHLVEMMLQGVDFARQAFEAGKGNRTDFAVFEGNGVAGVEFGADAVEAEQLAGHLEAGHLVATVFEQDVGLEEAAADGVDRVETFAGAVKMVAAPDAAAGRDQVVEALQFVNAQAEGQAQLAQVAVGTGRLDDGEGNFLIRWVLGHHQPALA